MPSLGTAQCSCNASKFKKVKLHSFCPHYKMKLHSSVSFFNYRKHSLEVTDKWDLNSIGDVVSFDQNLGKELSICKKTI